MNRKTKLLAAMLVCSSAFSLCSFTANAEENQPQPIAESRISPASFERYELSVSKVYNKSVSAYSKLDAAHNGAALASDVRMINGTP